MGTYRKRVLTALRWFIVCSLLVAMVGLLQSLTVRTVHAETPADTGGYPWANAVPLDAQFDWGYQLPKCPGSDPKCDTSTGTKDGKRYGDADLWGYTLRNCTSYVAWKIDQVFHTSISGWGPASHWAKGAPHDWVKSPSNYTPVPGDIAQWNNVIAGYGHVAYVFAVTNGIAKLSEYNFNHIAPGTFRDDRTTAGNQPDHYIHVGTAPPAPSSDPTKPEFYANKIVHWDEDHQPQKTAWYVSPDLRRHWIPDTSTYFCLRNEGIAVAEPISKKLLDQLPDQIESVELCGRLQPTAAVSVKLTPTPTPTLTPTAALSSYVNKIVQWDGDTATQKTSWLVAGDLRRYVVPESSTLDCLKSSGFAFAGALSSTILDQLPVKSGNSAACGKNALYANQRLFRGSYLRTSDGNYTLKLQNDGNLVLRGPDAAAVWANGKNSDYLVMQGDGNLVTYRFGGTATWATNTTGATKLAVQNGGKLVLYSASGAAIWDSIHGKL